MDPRPPSSESPAGAPREEAASGCPLDARDPFRANREATGILRMRAEGEDLPLILRLQDLRRTCKDWQTFSSDDPLRIVPHSEADVRSVRQLPIETDPPEHTSFRALVEPLFRRPQKDPEYARAVDALIAREVAAAVAAGEVEAVRGFALPLQSRALAHLLGVPESEAETWIGWGTHVYRDAGKAGEALSPIDRYFEEAFAAATDPAAPGFFGLLNHAEHEGRPLSHEEKLGFAHLAFAGGRDTVIHTLSSILEWLCHHPEALDALRGDDALISTATEEFVRWVSPLTAIARLCPHGGELPGTGTAVPPGGRVGLCWPSANRDGGVFDRPEEVDLGRSPNPHVGFGFGVHNCLGQHQARLIIRGVLREFAARVERLTLLEAIPQVETESSFVRQVGFEQLRLRLTPRAPRAPRTNRAPDRAPDQSPDR